jgi:hypothetical protein
MLPIVDGQSALVGSVLTYVCVSRASKLLTFTAGVQPAGFEYVSPFEKVLSGAQPGKPAAQVPLLSSSANHGALASLFDSAASFPCFLSSASFPCGDNFDKDPQSSPALMMVTSEPEKAKKTALQLSDLSISQPPSPKTPQQKVEGVESRLLSEALLLLDTRRVQSEIAFYRNPVSGHPRLVKSSSLAVFPKACCTFSCLLSNTG